MNCSIENFIINDWNINVKTVLKAGNGWNCTTINCTKLHIDIFVGKWKEKKSDKAKYRKKK